MSDRRHAPQQKSQENLQQQATQSDDTRRQMQQSHGDQQHRSKKDGHATQLGTGSDQNSQRNRGQGARRPG